MTIDELRNEIRANIGDSTSEYRSKLANQIIAHNISLKAIMNILLDDHPVSTRFSWLLGDIIIQSPDKSKEIIIECYKRLADIKIKNFDRTLSKQILICGDNLPIELEGRIVNDLFNWLNDTKITVSTKNNSLFALENLSKKYPELKEELIELIRSQKEMSTNDFKKRAEKVLSRLES